jgi:hypothetical protein
MSARLARGHDGRFGALLITPLSERDTTIEVFGVELVVACIDDARPHPHVTTFVRAPALGRRQWSVDDLDAITRCAMPVLRAGRPVAVHCRNGVSRSVTAAAAILVRLGSHSPADALAACRGHRPPSPTAVGSYWRWARAQGERS